MPLKKGSFWSLPGPISAHRFSSIRVATRILVFESGRIVGDGSHAELYASCPLYRELYDRQSL